MARSLDDIIASYGNQTGGGQSGGQSPFMSTPLLPPLPAVQHPVMTASGIGMAFSNPYALNYGSLASTQVSPSSAALFGQLGAHAPQAQFMTPNNFGVFRQPQQPIGAMGMGNIQSSVYPMPPLPGGSFFTQSQQFGGDFSQQSSRRDMVTSAASHVAMTQMSIGAVLGLAGGGIGAVLGGAFGGSAGAKFGGIAGTALGGLGGFSDAAGFAARSIQSPMIHQTAMALRMQESSGFMTGTGSGPTGQGLSTDAAMRVASQLSATASQSGGQFNRRDMQNIMSASSDNGLLDFAKNADQIVNTVKSVTKVLGAVARMTGDPDLRRNIALIGDLQRMGFTSTESFGALSNANAFSRLAGTSMSSLMGREGAAGAASFQGAGLLGASGATSAMVNAGLSRSSAMSGAVNPALMALMGGQSGLTQAMTQSDAAFLTGPGRMLMMGNQMRGGGNGAINMMGGINTAAQNLSSVSAISDFALHGNQQLNEAAKQLQLSNPLGLMMMKMQTARDLAKQFGGKAAGFGTGQGLMAMGMSGDEASAMQGMLTSDNFSNIKNQMQIQEYGRMQQGAARENARPGVVMSAVHDAIDRTIGRFSPFASSEYNRQQRAESAEDKRFEAMGRRRMRIHGLGMDAGDISREAHAARGDYSGVGDLESATPGLFSRGGMTARTYDFEREHGLLESQDITRRFGGGGGGGMFQNFARNIGSRNILGAGSVIAGLAMPVLAGMGLGVASSAGEGIGARASLSGIAEMISGRSDLSGGEKRIFSAERLARTAENTTGEEARVVQSRLSKIIGKSAISSAAFAAGHAIRTTRGEQIGDLDKNIETAVLESLSPDARKQIMQNPDLLSDLKTEAVRLASISGGSSTAAVLTNAKRAGGLLRSTKENEDRQRRGLGTEAAVRDQMGDIIGLSTANQKEQYTATLGNLRKKALNLTSSDKDADELLKKAILITAAETHPDSNFAKMVIKMDVGDPKGMAKARSLRADLSQDEMNTLLGFVNHLPSGSAEEFKKSSDLLSREVSFIGKSQQTLSDNANMEALAQKLNISLSGTSEEKASTLAKAIKNSKSSAVTSGLRKAAAGQLGTAAGMGEFMGAISDVTAADNTIMTTDMGGAGVTESKQSIAQMSQLGDFMGQFHDDFADNMKRMEAAAQKQIDAADKISDALDKASSWLHSDTLADSRRNADLTGGR